ncbi:DUF1990 domain-containing protein [Streptomyces sp. SID13031]|uniref:DUF1990 family protein n=1 Tax=Streptomyces sp. SID13031 TaxID=2706046 RepID=UPI0013CD38E7|nr:DUF1990 domain-containing protein [Streptomyces sp. SID13031]NEA31682.1 DUF1990 domain-containing protein [Streptomyces sp. SID13031]
MKLDDLSGQRFSYDAVGSTQYDRTPPGYHRLDYRLRIGTGDEVFRRAGEALLTWRAHRAAGIPVQATDVPLVVGTNSLGRLGVGPIGLPVPCRVVWVVDEPDRIGFAYGTLDGHPQAGEESLVVTREPDGIYYTILAYSRAATWYTRLGGPVSRTAQKLVAKQYARTLARLAN